MFWSLRCPLLPFRLPCPSLPRHPAPPPTHLADEPWHDGLLPLSPSLDNILSATGGSGCIDIQPSMLPSRLLRCGVAHNGSTVCLALPSCGDAPFARLLANDLLCIQCIYCISCLVPDAFLLVQHSRRPPVHRQQL